MSTCIYNVKDVCVLHSEQDYTEYCHEGPCLDERYEVKDMNEICNDNRFELINKYKQELVDATNIETSPEEMVVIDNILFRFWQMGWLDKLEKVPTPIVCNMQLTDFEEKWEDITDGSAYGEYLVYLMYKYDFEHNYRTSIEVVDISPYGFIWFDDWNEGEKNVIVQSYIKIDDVYNILLSR